MQALLEGDAEGLTRAAIARALEGDVAALRLCFDRLLPPPRDRPISFTLPAIATAAEAAQAMAGVLAAIASGEITPAEGEVISKSIETFIRVLELTEIEQRLSRLEQREDRR